MRCRPLDRRALDQGRDRIQVIGVNRDSKAEALERDAPTARGWVQNSHSAVPCEPASVRVRRRVAERPGVPVGVSPEPLASPVRVGDAHFGGHRIPMNTQVVQEPLPVGVGRQQRREHRRARRH